MTVSILHVAHAFSAQPTLGIAFPEAVIDEVPPAEAVSGSRHPDLLWLSQASLTEVDLLHRRYPGAAILATAARDAAPATVLALLAHGADLVLRDEGVLLAAAALQSLARRRRGTPQEIDITSWG